MRRPANIDPEKVREYARLGLFQTEIAGIFGVDETVIRRRFKKEVLSGKAERSLAIRGAQWKSMERGDVAMLIWLGKVELGQRETVAVEHSGPDGGAIKTETTIKTDFDACARKFDEFSRQHLGRAAIQADNN